MATFSRHARSSWRTFGSPAILLRSGIGPSSHLSDLDIAPIADLPVGDRLQDQPFFYNVYALKREVNAMKPASGAIIWTRSRNAEPGDLDLHISGTHLIDPSASPTGGAIVLAAAVWRIAPELRQERVP